jgi:hypothetical protein
LNIQIYEIKIFAYLIQIITIMFKRSVTPLTKDKPLSRNLSNHNHKVLREVKNIMPVKPVLSRNPSNSKITFYNQSSSSIPTQDSYIPTQGSYILTQGSSIQIQGVNPESP